MEALRLVFGDAIGPVYLCVLAASALLIKLKPKYAVALLIWGGQRAADRFSYLVWLNSLTNVELD